MVSKIEGTSGAIPTSPRVRRVSPFGEGLKEMSKRTWAVLAGVAMATGVACPALQGAKIVERIIARVNNEIITQRAYEKEQEKLRQQLAQQYSGAELEAQFKEQSKNLLRDLIDQSLMVQKAKDDDINVETDVVKQLDDIRKKNNFATLEDLETEVTKIGVNYEDFKDQIRRNLLMQEVISREVGSRIQVSRDDARKYFRSPQEGLRIAWHGAPGTDSHHHRKTQTGRSREEGERRISRIEGRTTFFGDCEKVLRRAKR